MLLPYRTRLLVYRAGLMSADASIICGFREEYHAPRALRTALRFQLYSGRRRRRKRLGLLHHIGATITVLVSPFLAPACGVSSGTWKPSPGFSARVGCPWIGRSMPPEFNLVDANEISALDQKRTLPHVQVMSALLPKADIDRRRPSDWRYGP